MRKAFTIAAICAVTAATSAGAQRREVSAISVAPADTGQTAGSRDSTDHPTRRRMASGFWLGVGTGIAALHTPAWAKGGLAGYFGGVLVGSALVRGKECTFAKRLGVSLAGTLGGAVISYFVASRTYLAKDLEAVAATVAVGGAPLAGAAIALRSCD